MSEEIRLTSLAHGGGCGCKLAPAVLRDILSTMPAAAPFANLLVGTETSDDAAVWKLNDQQALVATTDFFMPVVDAPFEFGRIAATNALSDIYAMGATPIFALAIVGMPVGAMPVAMIQKILEGGASVCAAAGIPVAGGHSIDSKEPIYGLVANGYLLDEFLRDGSNQRTGRYGGSREHRARLMFEVIEATCAVWGSDRVGLRLSPLNSYNSMIDSDPIGLSGWLAERLNDFNLAYLHLMRGDFFQQQHGDVLTPVRKRFNGVLVANMGYSADEAEKAIAAGAIDAVAFGTGFLANPDLPARIKAGAPLTPADPVTFYSPGAKGYTDYPVLTGAC